MLLSKYARALIAAPLVLLFVGCASSGATQTQDTPPTTAMTPQPAGPSMATAPAGLAPSDAALVAAETVELTGTELGTMWTFENAPLAYWQKTYGFEGTQEWLDHVRLSSVRFASWCSASFVSPDGLAMTNHHCARSCVDNLSSLEKDYIEDGFTAQTRDEELTCPGVYLDQLIAIEDVTARVHGSAMAGASDSEIAAARESMTEQIDEECEAETGLQCQVVSLFHGGQYQLYQYKRYPQVKLVFAPELQAGFFGGDPDNFTYPRFNLDVSFVRAYEEDGTTAAATPHYFTWSANGAREGELVFITGNPGSTQRQNTVTQLLYEQQSRHPFLANAFRARLNVLHAFAAMSEENNLAVRGNIFGLENSHKAYSGQLGGLQDPELMGRKIKWQRKFQAKVAADPELQAMYGDAWDQLAKVANKKAENYAKLYLYSPNMFVTAEQLQLAGLLVRYTSQMMLAEADRNPQFQGDGLAQTRQALENAAELDTWLATELVTTRLQLMEEWLPESDAIRQAAIRPGETPQQAATRLINGTQIGDPAFHATLMDGGSTAVAASDDPLIQLAVAMEGPYEQLTADWEEWSAAQTVHEERLAKALFAVFGTDLPPDATFTLRISDGVIKRYPYNGTFAAPYTTIAGMYSRAAEFGNEMPWAVPMKFAERRQFVRVDTPFNFVSTNDITGGNSGSPMINKDAEVVGIAFDGNIQQLPNQFLFSTEQGRTVAVHSSGILELLRSVYQATALADELIGSASE